MVKVTHHVIHVIIVSSDDSEFFDEMNSLGGMGWEIVYMRRAVAEDNGREPLYEVVLKRKTTSDPAPLYE